jgi:hypothetical protein
MNRDFGAGRWQLTFGNAEAWLSLFGGLGCHLDVFLNLMVSTEASLVEKTDQISDDQCERIGTRASWNR